jgi:AhpC/TSA antioxidant enzyme
LRAHEPTLREAGVRLAAIGLGDRRHAQAFRVETGIGFPLLVDEDRQAYRAAGLRTGGLWHLLRPDNFAARRRARAAGHRQHRLGKEPFQLGGSFVFGPGDVELYGHVSRTFGDTAPVADLLAAAQRAQRAPHRMR